MENPQFMIFSSVKQFLRLQKLLNANEALCISKMCKEATLYLQVSCRF